LSENIAMATKTIATNAIPISRAATVARAKSRGAKTGANDASTRKSVASVADAAPSAVAVQSWLSVVRAYNLCTAVLSQRLATLDLHIAEHEVLVNLLRAPGLTQQQLAERCFVAKSGISMLVTRMEGAGWLARAASERDARARVLHLTSKGLALARRAHAIQGEVVNAMTRQFNERELTFVDESMTKVSQALEAMKR
jgi:DNA-binding MarR family transcriptional regulator